MLWGVGGRRRWFRIQPRTEAAPRPPLKTTPTPTAVPTCRCDISGLICCVWDDTRYKDTHTHMDESHSHTEGHSTAQAPPTAFVAPALHLLSITSLYLQSVSTRLSLISLGSIAAEPLKLYSLRNIGSGFAVCLFFLYAGCREWGGGIGGGLPQ